MMSHQIAGDSSLSPVAAAVTRRISRLLNRPPRYLGGYDFSDTFSKPFPTVIGPVHLEPQIIHFFGVERGIRGYRLTYLGAVVPLLFGMGATLNTVSLETPAWMLVAYVVVRLVRTDDKRLWIGKFPEKADRCNLQRIEYATIELARHCGISTCNARLEPIGGGDVLMVERFDRQHIEDGYLRFGLVSGFTLLDCDESYLDRERWSYPLLADELRRWSEKPDEDRIELFRRIVFNAAVTNNDDHPRNHAVRRTARGWRLSPAYDLVPAPMVSLERRDLAMTIGAYGRTASVYNLLSQCQRFGLTTEAARNEIDRMVVTLKTFL